LIDLETVVDGSATSRHGNSAVNRHGCGTRKEDCPATGPTAVMRAKAVY